MKKISLEHLIRNVVNESVGNVNDPNGPPKAVFNKPVQIEPPTGEEHGSMRALTVSNQRKTAKQQDSETRNTFAEDTTTGAIANNVPKISASSFIGPNAGPLGFGVVPQGIPSIENTKNLSPVKPENIPVEAQKAQRGEDAKDAEKANTSTSNTSSRSTRRSVQRENFSLEHSIRYIVERGKIDVKPKPDIEIPSRRRPDVETPKGPEVSPVSPAEIPDFGPPKRVKTVPVEPEVPAKPSKPAEPAPVEPEVPAKPSKPAEPAPAEPEVPTRKPSKTPKETPEEPTVPREKPEERPAEKPSEKVDEKPEVKIDTKVETKPETKADPKTRENAPNKTDVKEKPKTTIIPPLFGGSKTPDDGVPKDAINTWVNKHIHGVKARLLIDPSIMASPVAKQILKKKSMKEETDRKDIDLVSRDKTERKKVEYVGRDKLNAKKTLGRQAAYKTNVIDEAEELKPSKAAKIKSIVLDKKEEKLGINPAVETEPRLKPLHMAENSLAKTIGKNIVVPGGLGAAAGATSAGTGASEKIDNFVDPYAKKVAEKIPEPVKKTTSDVARKIRLSTETERVVPTTQEISANLAKKQQNIAAAQTRQATTRDMEAKFQAGKISADELERHYKESPSMTGPVQKMMRGAKTTIDRQAADPEGTRETMKRTVETGKLAGMALKPYMVGAPIFAADTVGSLEKGRYTQAALDAASAVVPGKAGTAAVGGSIGHQYAEPFDPDEDVPRGATEPSKPSNASTSSSPEIETKKVKSIKVINKD